MRKIACLSCVLLVLSSIVLSAYDVIIFGDVHYDSADVRDMSVERPAYQEREMKRNISLWASGIPAMLDAAEKKVGKDTAFVAQLGDIVQGDCGSRAFHEKSLTSVLGIFNGHFSGTRFLAVPGNHDIRGAGGHGAYDAVMRPYLSKTLGEQLLADGPVQYAVMQEKDLFVFLDCNNPDLKFLQETLAAHPTRRHLFVLTHFPVLFLSHDNPMWTLFYKKPEVREPLFKLLAENHAIVLCAHVHITTLVRWKSESGTFTQVSLCSLCRSETNTVAMTERDMKKPFVKFMDSPDSEEKRGKMAVLAKYLPGYTEFKDIKPVSSFAVLKPCDAGVTLEMYTAQETNPVHTLTLK